MSKVIFVCVFLISCAIGATNYNVRNEGDACTDFNSETGVCTNINNCTAAIEDLRNKRRHTICGFNSAVPLVCCPIENITNERSKYLECTPETTRRANLKIGHIAFEKCLFYQETLRYPCKLLDEAHECKDNQLADQPGIPGPGYSGLPPAVITGGEDAPRGQFLHMLYSPDCLRYQEQLRYDCKDTIDLTKRSACGESLGNLARVARDLSNLSFAAVGGVDAPRGQFSHMALLGYGEGDVQWICGGTVVSERYILTAGHCTSHPRLGPVSQARVGFLKRSDAEREEQLYRILKAIPHPDYKPPAKYHDIALLQTERDIKFDTSFVVPACLNVDEDIEEERRNASATGWGNLAADGDLADTLQHLEITKFSTEECWDIYGPDRHLEGGFNESTQLCYGDHDEARDTCQGDSGGPLQITGVVNCMYTVIGVTSFGRACGLAGRPGVYTRVFPYVTWVEGVVWPRNVTGGTDDDRFVFVT